MILSKSGFGYIKVIRKRVIQTKLQCNEPKTKAALEVIEMELDFLLFKLTETNKVKGE